LRREHAHHRGDRFRRARQHHQLRRRALEGVAVALVDLERRRLIHHTVVADEIPKALRDQFGSTPANGPPRFARTTPPGSSSMPRKDVSCRSPVPSARITKTCWWVPKRSMTFTGSHLPRRTNSASLIDGVMPSDWHWTS